MARAKEQKKQASIRDYKVLIEPVITEKTSIIGEGGQNVVFKVDINSTKPEIRNAVEAIFDVKVADIRTCNYIGKVKRVTGSVGRRAGYRKAYITLEPGHTIDVVEGL